MNWNRARSRRGPLGALCAALVLALLSGCGGEAGGDDLDRYLCEQTDVGADFQELARGNFSPRDLADLGADADTRERQFREAGMERGRFAFHKELLPKPPFDPPVNVLCQVMEFESEAAARRFVDELPADEGLARVLMGWAPAGDAMVEGYDPARADVQPDTRAFVITSDRDDAAQHIGVTAASDGNIVRILAAGWEIQLIDPPWEGWPDSWQRWVEGG